MTNFSRQFALKGFAASFLCLILCGCGSDPAKEYAKGVRAFENGDYGFAVEKFRGVIGHSPENVDALVMLARSEFAVGAFDKAEEALTKASATNPDDIDIIELSAQIAFYRKDYKGATGYYARLASGDGFDGETRARGWTGLGVIDFLMIGLHPDKARFRHESRVKFLQAIILDRRNASARYHLGRLYRDTFQYLEAARDEFDVFVHLSPVADERVKKIKNEVLPSLKSEIARSSAPSSRVDSPGCASFLKQADAAFRRKSWKSAITAYAKAFKKDPGSFPAAVGLARAYVHSNRSGFERGEAMKMYLAACKIRPSAISTYIEAAQFALVSGKPATSVELYSRALAAKPASKAAVEGLILALTKTGDAQAASVYRGYLRTLSNARQ